MSNIFANDFVYIPSRTKIMRFEKYSSGHAFKWFDLPEPFVSIVLRPKYEGDIEKYKNIYGNLHRILYKNDAEYYIAEKYLFEIKDDIVAE